MAVLSWVVPALHVAALALFLALDLTDFYFKTAWLGPHEAFGFPALGSATFTDDAPLTPTVNVSALAIGDDVDFTSGWPSFLSQCGELYGADSGSGLVLYARATHCRLGVGNKQFTANDLFLVAGARVDAVAWTACKLLYLHRRPPLCQENVVTEFFHRYRLNDPVIAADAMADANSDAEHELLAMIDLISRSYPLQDVVCVEGFQSSGDGVYPAATLVACASPNVFDAAFVGLHTPAFTVLHRDKAYLTVDVLNIMGFEFVIRQNCKSAFRLSTENKRVTLEHHTRINFSSFGHLYLVAIAIDVALLVAHTRSALETATVLLLPLLGTRNGDDVARLTQEYSWTILYRSLYRSPPIVALTLLSGLLSWQFQMPNAIVWTWNQQSSGKVFAVLASVRVWMVVCCLVNCLWSLVVAVSETRAYRFVQKTFVSTFEILTIGVVVAIIELRRTFAVSNAKYAAESQRLWDSDSFPRHTMFANSWNEELDYLLCTTTNVLGIVYAPLAVIVGESLLVVAAVVALKWVYYTFVGRRAALLEQDASETVASMYARLPLEELLRVPVRAQSLVRSALPLELVAHEEPYLPPSIYFDFGVILDNDIIRTRRGFFNVIHLKVDVAKYFSPAGGHPAAVASVASVAAITTVGVRRGSAFYGIDAAASSFTKVPPTATTSPLPRPPSSKAMMDAVAATDGVRPASSSSGGVDGADGATGRRPLATTAGSPSSRSMRRRKSTSELPAADDGF